ncbi:MAG: IscA/HesB family protein [Desulfovibrio sp.]|nr:IscA/HesB family protein [Desulfovibrio sp.]
MIELSDSARKEFDEFFAAKPDEQKNIRIFKSMSCSGPRLNLALDNPNEEDAVEKNGDYQFCINKELKDQIKSVKIDLSYMGFIVEPEVPLPAPKEGESCCASCGGGCH